MESSPSHAAQARVRALEAEQVRTIRRMNRLRLFAAALFGLMHVALGYAVDPVWHRPLPLFALATAGVALLEVLGRRGPRQAQLTALALPFLDLPVVYAVQATTAQGHAF